MIEARDLTKIYAGKAAVDHLTFTVEPGQVTGFLGPNGAGKSTTMRLILGLDRPQSGIALINGRRYRDLKDPLRTVGALLEAKTVHPGRSARNHLLFLAQTQGLPARRVEEVLALVGLQDVADKRAGGFSLGMSQRLGVAVAMLGDPQVLLLDEPVNGLDPEGVLWIRNLMKQLAAEGRTILVCIGFTALIAWLTESHWYGPRAAARDATAISDPVGFILGTGVGLGQLAIGVLGVLVITSEYSSGVIRASLLAVPRRLPVLAAKAVVFAVLLLVVTEIVAFCSFFVGSAILHAHVPVSLSDSGVTRAVAGAGLYLTVLGLLALAIGTMIRHTAGAISTIIGIVFVLPILTGLLPSSWGAHINAYLPEQAGTLITHTHEQSGDLLSPWQGFGVLCIWTVLALAAAAYLLERRDA
jgi:ABC-type Na+ transport system ATPase subunit NatA/ABC-type transport system involved in multi-copper enzyme maturation permease subunit